MATAKKHGNRYQILVFDGYYEKDGVKKKKYKTISAKTKDEAEYQAAMYKQHRKKNYETSDYTVSEAIENYIKAKELSLSPSTISSYWGIYHSSFKDIADIPLSKLTNRQLQASIDNLRNCPKTIHNKYTLFKTAASYYSDYRWKITLPMIEKAELTLPTSDNIDKMLSMCKNHRMIIAIYLGAFAPMRRAEVSALTFNDIDGLNIKINKSLVKKNGQWIVKTPKSKAGYREVEMPEFVIDEIRKEYKGNDSDRIVKMSPDRITKNWNELRRKCNLTDVRFHDLRHYGASILHSLGIPDEYILKRGGWSTDSVMKSIYRGALDDVAIKMNKKANDYFTETFNTSKNTSK